MSLDALQLPNDASREETIDIICSDLEEVETLQGMSIEDSTTETSLLQEDCEPTTPPDAVQSDAATSDGAHHITRIDPRTELPILTIPAHLRSFGTINWSAMIVYWYGMVELLEQSKPRGSWFLVVSAGHFYLCQASNPAVLTFPIRNVSAIFVGDNDKSIQLKLKDPRSLLKFRCLSPCWGEEDGKAVDAFAGAMYYVGKVLLDHAMLVLYPIKPEERQEEALQLPSEGRTRQRLLSRAEDSIKGHLMPLIRPTSGAGSDSSNSVENSSNPHRRFSRHISLDHQSSHEAKSKDGQQGQQSQHRLRRFSFLGHPTASTLQASQTV